ncbi:PLP-dependent aminotransferase family protein [Piscinibacter sakaiensis]|uniref:GntR family transcriptional regulator STM2803 n=1 Tax=Piscinibacter sakaiensis TaxID=1547922 RepID=A0A0K8NUQ1_PISS1|nr:PLP-dependent aminotransferase family protein [Piscinibacter sakaiensis]GAP34098.1 GntR family transcriptional regulator STM2803 [Piscinibacter sakaiensis]
MERAKPEQARPATGPAIALSPEGFARDQGLPVYRQLYASIKAAILAGTFPDGARLPSSRSLATQLSLSRTTVDLAYNLLAGDGLVQGRTARGTLVTSRVRKVGGARGEAARPSPDRQAIAPMPLAPDCAAVDLFPRAIWARLATRTAKRLLPEDLCQGDPAGVPRLREAIANRTRLLRGVECDARQVFVTAGTGGAVLLCAAALELVGRPVVGDTSTLSSAVGQALALLGVAPAAPDVQAGCQGRWPAAACAWLTVDDFLLRDCVPDSAAIGALGQWARTQAAWLIEEDHDLDLFQDSFHASMLVGNAAAQDRSIYLGSFARSLFPAIDCGFLIVPPAQVERFEQAAQRMPWAAPVHTQRIVSDFITQGYIGRYANRLRRAHAERRRTVADALQNGAATRSLQFESHGSSLVARLRPAQAEALQPVLRASGLGAAVVDGPTVPRPLLRVGYAGTPPKELWAAIARLDALL